MCRHVCRHDCKHVCRHVSRHPSRHHFHDILSQICTRTCKQQCLHRIELCQALHTMLFCRTEPYPSKVHNSFLLAITQTTRRQFSNIINLIVYYQISLPDGSCASLFCLCGHTSSRETLRCTLFSKLCSNFEKTLRTSSYWVNYICLKSGLQTSSMCCTFSCTTASGNRVADSSSYSSVALQPMCATTAIWYSNFATQSRTPSNSYATILDLLLHLDTYSHLRIHIYSTCSL